MAYHNWLTKIYNDYDGIFKHYEALDNINWLENIIQKHLGKEYLFYKNGNYKFKPKDEYEGYKRKLTTEGVE